MRNINKYSCTEFMQCHVLPCRTEFSLLSTYGKTENFIRNFYVPGLPDCILYTLFQTLQDSHCRQQEATLQQYFQEKQ